MPSILLLLHKLSVLEKNGTTWFKYLRVPVFTVHCHPREEPLLCHYQQPTDTHYSKLNIKPYIRSHPRLFSADRKIHLRQCTKTLWFLLEGAIKYEKCFQRRAELIAAPPKSILSEVAVPTRQICLEGSLLECHIEPRGGD